MKKIFVLSTIGFLLFSCAKTEEVDDSDFSKISLEIDADKLALKVGDTLNLVARYRNEYNVRKQVVPTYTFNPSEFKMISDNQLMALEKSETTISAVFVNEHGTEVNNEEDVMVSISDTVIVNDEVIVIDEDDEIIDDSVTTTPGDNDTTTTVTEDKTQTRKIGSWEYNDYTTTGDASLIVDENNDLILRLESTFSTKVSGGTGAYFYLADKIKYTDKNEWKTSGSLRITPEITLDLINNQLPMDINISEQYPDSDFKITDYSNLVIWCEPFGIWFAGGELGPVQ